MGIGAIIMDQGHALHEHSLYVPAHWNNSNNVAEYMGFIWLVKTLITDINTRAEKEMPEVVICGDSQLVVMQMNGDWRIKDGRYVVHALEASRELMKLKTMCKITIA